MLTLLWVSVYLAGTQSHFGVGGFAQLREFGKDGHKLIGQCGVPSTQLILKTDRQRQRITESSRKERNNSILYHVYMCVRVQVCTHDQHGDQGVLLGDLGMGEDIVKNIGHVAFVFFTQGEHTLVVVT